MHQRFGRLGSKSATLGWIAVIGPWVWKAVGAASNVDWLRQQVPGPKLTAMWGLVQAHGTVITMVLGFVWLTVLVLRPESSKGAFPLLSDADLWNSIKRTEVVGVSYENEKVELDGRRFVNCKFTGVTFVFHGTAPFEFIPQCDFTAPMSFETDSIPIRIFNEFSEGMTLSLQQVYGPGYAVVTEKTNVDMLGNKTKVPALHVLSVKKNEPRP